MKSIYLLFIFYLTIYCIPFPSFPSFPSFNKTWEFNINFGNFLSKLKSSTPDFIKDIQKTMEEFIKKSEKEKDKYINILSGKVKQSYNKIKDGMKKGNKSVQSEIKNLIEKITETAKALSYKLCDLTNKEKEKENKQCIINKKKLFGNLLNIVNKNFGKCSIIVNEIKNLSENMEYNLKYFLFLAISLTENPDAIEKGTSQIIYDIINCLQEKFQYLWPLINTTITNKISALNVKQDIINLLAKSISNFVTFIQFEEKYGFIEKAENITGLIKNENAKKVYKNIFKIIKKFNEFGTQSYNISENLNLNVFTNDKNIKPNMTKEIEYKNKGIKIILHMDYIFKNFKAYSIQTAVFESPLVSLRAERKTAGGTANTFVGITLYDKEGNEIYVKDIKLDKLRPIILFKKKLFKAMKTCLYYNEEKDSMDNEGIETQFFEFDGEEYIKCIPKHLSAFTIGVYSEGEKENDIKENIEEKNINININKKRVKNSGVKIVFVFIISIILVWIFYFFRCSKRGKAKNINSFYFDSVNNKIEIY